MIFIFVIYRNIYYYQGISCNLKYSLGVVKLGANVVGGSRRGKHIWWLETTICFSLKITLTL